MFESLLVLTALVLATGTVAAYQRTRDVMHPMLFIAPLFFYTSVVDPWLVRTELHRFFRRPEDINFFLLLNLLGVAALVLGLLHQGLKSGSGRSENRTPLRAQDRVNLQRFAFVLAALALVAYGYGIANVGGFVEAFSRVKGGGRSGSGYLGEAMNLGLVAAAMVALSRYRRGLDTRSLMLLLLGLLPNLVQGTFGGRRGPIFLATVSLAIAWLITRRRPPRPWMLGVSMAAVLVSVLFVWSHRQFLYMGSDQAALDWDVFQTTVSQADLSEGNNFVYGAAFVLATRDSGQYTWGRELFVNVLVRPIPRQLWPTKYEDVGATWVTNLYPGLGPMTGDDWLTSVGWLPLPGSSAISISDLYGEFAWGAVLVMYLVGRGFAALRTRRLLHGGIWGLLYLEALMLSIYLATQSFSAFYHRYLILSIPTIAIWHLATSGRSTLLPARPSDRAVAWGNGLAGERP